MEPARTPRPPPAPPKRALDVYGIIVTPWRRIRCPKRDTGGYHDRSDDHRHDGPDAEWVRDEGAGRRRRPRRRIFHHARLRGPVQTAPLAAAGPVLGPLAQGSAHPMEQALRVSLHGFGPRGRGRSSA